MGLNQAILFGNLGADPELRMTPGGQAVLKLRLATSESFLDRNRVRQERTEWHSVTVWGKRGESLARILSKGSRVLVVGRIRTQSYDDREGVRRTRTEINATDIQLADGMRPERQSEGNSEPDDALPPDSYPDDIPF